VRRHLPPSILDLFVSAAGKGRSRRFYQGFHHYAGSNPNFGFPGESRFWYVNELYAGSASYLISAGANPSYYAYTANIAGLSHPGDNADFGVALPTTLMPSLDSPQGESGISLGNIIQFGRAPGDFDSENHLCVAPDFACGGPIYVPNAFEPAKNPKDPNLVSDGNWTFVNRGSDGTKPGYYLAIYRVSNPGSTGLSGDWGFLEAYDTWFHPGLSFSPPLDFGDFQQAVKRANPSIQLQVSNDQKCGLVFLCGINDYVTVSGQHIHFKLGTPRSTIISTTAEPDRTAYTNTFAHGSIIKSDQRPTLVPTGSGLITISNPALGEQLILDARDINRPSRTSESGHVESAGANQEVWVDSKYPGTGPTAGDFGDPFRTLTDAKKGVAVGGTINIINAGRQNAPTVFSKRMTIRAVPGPATFIQ
jgi:hypothetical protein